MKQAILNFIENKSPKSDLAHAMRFQVCRRHSADRCRLLVEQSVHHRLGGQHRVGFGIVGALFTQDLAKDLVAHRFRRLEGAPALAGRTRLAQGLYRIGLADRFESSRSPTFVVSGRALQ